MIITVTLTPALDKTVTLPGFAINQLNRVEHLRLDAGGKGINVSKVIQTLGGKSMATGILGGATGRFIQAYLDESGIDNDFVFVSEDTRTNLKIVDPLNQTNTDINEPGAPVSQAALDGVFDRITARLTGGDSVVLAGKAPQGFPDTLFARWIAALKARGAKVYLDADDGLLAEGVGACPHLIKPNLEELSRLIGRRLHGAEDMLAAARSLNGRGIHTVVVSLGGDGALFVSGDDALYGHGLAVPVRSTVGAGDAMVAAMCHGEAAGLGFRAICRMAMAVSAASVMCSGTQPPPPEMVTALIDRVQLVSP